MKILQKIVLLLTVALCSGCYEDYIHDYESTSVGFAVAKPLRTVIADRGMEIRVGVSIGGKRQVDMNDWAKFEIDGTLLEGTGMELLPTGYYTLADPNTFRVAKENLPVADVAIQFTQAFYDDPKSVGWSVKEGGKVVMKSYALPFKITESSLDNIPEDRKTSLVAIKYISTFHGTYYVKGAVSEMDANGATVNTITYSDKDLIKNMTRDIRTLSTVTLERPGIANLAVSDKDKVKLTVAPVPDADTYNVSVETADKGIEISDGEGFYYPKKEKPEFALTYSYSKDGKKFVVSETLVLRQDPLKDLRVETW